MRMTASMRDLMDSQWAGPGGHARLGFYADHRQRLADYREYLTLSTV